MNKLFNIFTLNKENAAWGWVAIIFGSLAALLTISMGIPQLIHMIKTKKTGSVKYYSYWTFYFALFFWILVGSFDIDDNKMVVSGYANIICAFIYCFTMWALYHYSDSKKRRKAQWPILFSLLATTATISSLGIWGIVTNKHMENNTFSVLMIIIPIITTFAFAPLILKQFETKDFSGMSIFMTLVMASANLAWIIYWIALIGNSRNVNKLLTPLVWQVISLIIYVAQFIMTLIYGKKKSIDNTVIVTNESVKENVQK